MAGEAATDDEATADARSAGWRLAFGSTLTLAMAVGTLLPFSLGVLAPFVVADLDLSRSRFGALTTAFYLVGVPFSLLAGSLVDRLGGRRVMLVLFGLGAASVLVAGAAPGYAVLLVAAAIGGLATATVNPVTNQLIARHVPMGRQGTIVGVKQSGVYVGLVLAGTLLPLGAESFGWRGALTIGAVLGLSGIVLTVLVVPRDESSTRGAIAAPTPRAGTSLGADIWWLAGLTLFMGAVPAVVAVYLPLYAFEELGLDETGAGLLAAASAAVAVAGRIAWGRAAERARSIRGLLLAMTALTLVSLLMLWGAPRAGAWLLWAGALVFGASVSAWMAIVYLAVIRDVPAGSTGRSSGVIQLAFYLGYAAYPVTFGVVVDDYGGYAVGWIALVGVGLVSLVLLTVWHPAEVGIRPASAVVAPTQSPAPAPREG